VSVLGIDLAAGSRKTYACALETTSVGLAAELFERCDDDVLLELARGREKVAIDAPFGWPDEFVDALVAHRAGGSWPRHDEDAPEALRAALSFRETDRVVMRTRRPLSVSTDKLGVTAMRCAALLHRWSLDEDVDRSGLGKFVEVYPAAALVRWGFEGGGYKNANRGALPALLEGVCQALPELYLAGPAQELCATNDDAFDALVAALVARAALLGRTEPPPAEHLTRARQEGWIHLPRPGSLSRLGQPLHSCAGLRISSDPLASNRRSSR
jgi:hypothetical protein